MAPSRFQEGGHGGQILKFLKSSLELYFWFYSVRGHICHFLKSSVKVLFNISVKWAPSRFREGGLDGHFVKFLKLG